MSVPIACGNCSTRRPPLPLSLHQLHQLRPPLFHHHRHPLRPAVHHHGRVSPLSLTAAPNTRIRPTAASMPSRMPARPAGRGWSLLDCDGRRALPAIRWRRPLRCCKKGRSWRSRGSAATIWRWTPATRMRSGSSGGARSGTKNLCPHGARPGRDRRICPVRRHGATASGRAGAADRAAPQAGRESHCAPGCPRQRLFRGHASLHPAPSSAASGDISPPW